MARKTTRAKRAAATRQITFDYIKSNHFRVVHADGAIGGVAAGGYIHMALFSERGAIPQQLVFAVDEKGRLGDEVSRTERGTLIREVEVDVMMDEPSASALHRWLGDKIEELR